MLIASLALLYNDEASNINLQYDTTRIYEDKMYFRSR